MRSMSMLNSASFPETRPLRMYKGVWQDDASALAVYLYARSRALKFR